MDVTHLEQVTLTAADGHTLTAFRSAPKGRRRGGLVVVQTASGLSPYLRQVCDFFSDNGYLAVAPALYDRQRLDAVFDHSPEGSAEANRLRKGLVWESVLADIQAAQDLASEAGPVGIVGYCVGGSATWLAATSLRFAAAVGYYGKDIVDFLNRQPRCPVMLHFGSKDSLIPVEDASRVSRAFPDVPVHLYPASHGFDDPSRGFPEASELARKRTIDFFRTHLG